MKTTLSPSLCLILGLTAQGMAHTGEHTDSMSSPVETDARFSILPVSPIPPFSLSTQLLPSCSDDFSYSQTSSADSVSQTYTESEAPTTIGHITGSAPPPTGTASDTSAASYTSSDTSSDTSSTTDFTTASTTASTTGTVTASQTSTAGAAAAVVPPALGHLVAGLGVMALTGLGMGVAI
ncbi:hypothetical protein E4U59_001432 [Claviceps monticola]|nr:hypothetical protein E4U59_001432 [Claviceps monticola]